ncbi:neuraminidase-like domain-containing protein [Pantoea endophytica]|uniref:Tc toxin subunit A-related protein n=1 Tax=Pantoea endophytica TaxID=92488 RepID=UPI00301615AC
MYNTEDILKKLSTGLEALSGPRGDLTQITLAYVMEFSFAEINRLAADRLTWGEKKYIFREAQKQRKANRQAEISVLSRATPLLARVPRLGIEMNSLSQPYNTLFGERNSRFVKPGSVASMFSPAAYLTELYREARCLHESGHENHLDVRRPDLASLLLSQENLDHEVSTLSLVSGRLMGRAEAVQGTTRDGLLQMLSTFRHTGLTPFDLHAETIRQSVALYGGTPSFLRDNPELEAEAEGAALPAFMAGLSPGLYGLLLEDITEESADTLFKKNFGDKADEEAFRNPSYLARYYDMSHAELDSVLGMLVTGADFSPGLQYYRNNQLVALVGDGDDLNVLLIKRTPRGNYYQFGFAELIPRGDGNYTFNFTIVDNARKGSLAVGTNGKHGGYDVFYDASYDVKYGVPITLSVTLSEEKIGKTVPFGVTRLGGRYYANVDFEIRQYPYTVFLLKLNKIVRLYKATAIPPADILAVTESINPDLNITRKVLERLMRVRGYMQRYCIGVSDALVLAGADISRADAKQDAFTRLFNSPPLNGKIFEADDAVIDLTPGLAGDNFRTGVLKRAFGVNDAGLYALWGMAEGTKEPNKFVCSMHWLSALCRVKLLADVHGLNVTELSALMELPPYHYPSLLSPEPALTRSIDMYTRWLRGLGWTVGDLYLMLSDRVSPLAEPQAQQLLLELKHSLTATDAPADTESCIRAIIPLISAALQTDTATAEAILLWAGDVKAGGLTLVQFIGSLITGARSALAEGSSAPALFCHVMGQMALMAVTLKLPAEVLLLAVTRPEKFRAGASILPLDIATIHSLSRFHEWLQRYSESAPSVLPALKKGTLTPAQFAQATGLDVKAVSQALALTDKGAETFSHWTVADRVLQWLDAARVLSITPLEVSALLSLSLTGDTGTLWQAQEKTARSLQAGLSPALATRLQDGLDEALVAALSAYVTGHASPVEVADRNGLYAWMLTDTAVSAQVKTTRLADAIGAVQLYVNLALSAQPDEGTDMAARSRPFFSDWEAYNKRYSTWAGVSRLAYYPENYIDPTIRAGQTGMMDEMLQSLSQSQLTSDTVEDAFKTYMTRFETIANLDVVSAYHDGLSTEAGLTWLVGCNATEHKYYWRTLNQSDFSGGRFAVNAWSDWHEIRLAVRPVNQQIRPVIFNSRLYLVWLEQKETADDDGKKSLMHELKYAHIRHDGTWSGIFTVDADAYLKSLPGKAADCRLYCSGLTQRGEGSLLVLFYAPAEKAEDNKATPATGLTINIFHHAAQTGGDFYKSLIWSQMDTRTVRRISQPFSATSVSIKSVSLDAYGWGDDNLTMLYGGKLHSASVTSGQNGFRLSFGSDVRVIYNGLAGTRTWHQVNVIKWTGSNRTTKFAIYRRLGENPQFNKSGQMIYPVYRFNSRTMFGGLLTYRNNPALNLSYWIPEYEKRILMSSSKFNYLSLPVIDSIPDEGMAGAYIFLNDDAGSATDVSGGYQIDVNINPDRVTVSASASGQTLTVNAQDHIGNALLPVLNLDETVYKFRGIAFDVPLTAFHQGLAEVSVSLKAEAVDGRDLGSQHGIITLAQAEPGTQNVMTLMRTDTGAQYLQKGPYRTRLNTLFAHRLTERAGAGLDAVLAMETQLLPEPQLGQGAFIRVTLPVYNGKIHGPSRPLRLMLWRALAGEGQAGYFYFWEGALTDQPQTLTLFVPFSSQVRGDPLDFPYAGTDRGVELYTVRAGQSDGFIGSLLVNRNNSTGEVSAAGYKPHASSGEGIDVVLLDRYAEPMDFAGANALYFWEMFYYVPMMVFRRLLDESHFTEAARWLKYIWSPEGYYRNGDPAPWLWNVRPLEEDTSWNATPLDSTDPDAVAQADPMHYKVATLMAQLDLLIARGDAAYRRLERDAMAEAAMWYVQAQNLLGAEPWLSHENGWGAPRLDKAADQTLQRDAELSLLLVREQRTEVHQVLTANSLTSLFLPEHNEKLQSYWLTLSQRLYNLRHSLSIDGQPLSLPVYAAPADPQALLHSAAFKAGTAEDALPGVALPLWRFPAMLESARSMTAQLGQFGSQLLSLSERQDAETLSAMLQTQGAELMLQSINLQERQITEADADIGAMEFVRSGASDRVAHYAALYDENVSGPESMAQELSLSATVMSSSSMLSYTIAAAADTVPNIYGLAVGGSHYGAIPRAVGLGMEVAAQALRGGAERIGQSELYRRRRQEWDIQRKVAESDVKLADAQLTALRLRREAAVMQKAYLLTQQRQMQAQLSWLLNKFSHQALYSWLRGRLAMIYRQFYDLSLSRCLMAQEACRQTLSDQTLTFIRPGAWQGAQAGLLAGESLSLGLAQMEQAWLKRAEREKEVTRTVCLSEVYAALPDGAGFSLTEKAAGLSGVASGSAGTGGNGLKMEGGQLQATVTLKDLHIMRDYPDSLGGIRRIRQVSVTLPALTGPYQDVRAVLSYGGSTRLPHGCNAFAVSHGMNDSGQFQLDFNDARWLPFEGIPVDDTGMLTLSFPDAATSQKDLLQSLADIILHIRYTIRG